MVLYFFVLFIGRSVEDQLTDSGSSSGLFPVMLHQNTAAFSGSNAGFPQGFPQLGGTASSSQRSGFNQPIPSTSTSQSTADLFANPVPGTSHSSQDGGASDPSGGCFLKLLYCCALSDRSILVMHLAVTFVLFV